MTTESVADENGKTMLVKRIHKGRLLPTPFSASGTEKMYQTPLRFDDVLLCSYPKSGSHWIWENLRFLIKGETSVDYVEKDELLLDLHEFGHVDDAPSPRVLANHACFDCQPKDLLKGNVKLIFAYRNPKDVVVSFYHHILMADSFQYDGEFSAFLKLFVQGKAPYNYLEYMKSWEEGLKANPNIPCLFVRYEDLIKNPLNERRKLAHFLGKDYDDAFLRSVVEATSIDKMRINKESTTLKGKDGSCIMYRQGKIGDWKRHFTVSENEWFDDFIRENLGASNMFYKFIYE